MSRINPFKHDSLKFTNRFSMLEEKEEKLEIVQKEMKAEPYNRSNNSFLKPLLRRNEYYLEEPKPLEKTLCPADFPELFVSKKEDNTQNKRLDFANKLLQKNEEEQNETVESVVNEELAKPLNVSHTPIDTLNVLCDLYAYQERWGRYWYGNEAYDEMYGIDKLSSQYEIDNQDLENDDFSNEDEDDDDFY